MNVRTRTGIRLAAVLCILCFALSAHAQDEPRIGLLQFTAHISAQNDWDEAVLEQLRDRIREELVSHGISVIPPDEIPDELSPMMTYDAEDLPETTWEILNRVHGHTKFVLGTVENHKTGETSLSLAWIIPESGRVMKSAAITLDAGEGLNDNIMQKFVQRASDVIRAGAY